MKQRIFRFAFVLPAVLFFFAACTKDNNNTNPPKTKTQLITQGSWKFKSATANGTDISNQNPPFEPCKKDNILTFSNTGTGNMNEGATKCNAGDPDNTSFSWTFFTNETGLRISTPLFTGGNSDFTLESLTETELVVSQGYTPIAGATYLIKITFIH